MGAVEEAMSAVAASRDTVDGQLTVAGFETSIPSLAAPLVQRLSRDEPRLHVRVIQEAVPRRCILCDVARSTWR